MKTTSDIASDSTYVPSSARANTRRDARTAPGMLSDEHSGQSSGGMSFEQILQSTWYGAARRGFTPGHEREYLLEAAFKHSQGRDKADNAGT